MLSEQTEYQPEPICTYSKNGMMHLQLLPAQACFKCSGRGGSPGGNSSAAQSIKSLEVVRFEKIRDFGSARIELNLVQVLGEQAKVYNKAGNRLQLLKQPKIESQVTQCKQGPKTALCCSGRIIFSTIFLHFWMGQGWGRANERRMASVSAFAPAPFKNEQCSCVDENFTISNCRPCMGCFSCLSRALQCSHRID